MANSKAPMWQKRGLRIPKIQAIGFNDDLYSFYYRMSTKIILPLNGENISKENVSYLKPSKEDNKRNFLNTGSFSNENLRKEYKVINQQPNILILFTQMELKASPFRNKFGFWLDYPRFCTVASHVYLLQFAVIPSS
jgi:hypothetical protein